MVDSGYLRTGRVFIIRWSPSIICTIVPTGSYKPKPRWGQVKIEGNFTTEQPHQSAEWRQNSYAGRGEDGKWATNVQNCHKISKLYLVHLRLLRLHGIFLVVLSIQVPVVPSCHGTTQDILGTPHYLTPPCQSQVWVVPSCHGTTKDIPGTSQYLQSQQSKQFVHVLANTSYGHCAVPIRRCSYVLPSSGVLILESHWSHLLKITWANNFLTLNQDTHIHCVSYLVCGLVALF